MNPKIAIFAIVASLLFVAFAIYFGSAGADGNSVEGLRDVVSYVDPNAYYDIEKVYTLRNTDAGLGVALLPKPAEPGTRVAEPNFVRQQGFVGPESCKECHADYYQSFVQTAHYKTSALASASSILGSFADNENVLKTRKDGFGYQLTQEEDEYFQKLLVEKSGKTYEHKCRFDIVTGSGNIGQTYLYWQENSLYQLPVSWLSKSGWANSPNYPDGLANFARPVKQGCMSCHSTLVEFADKQVNVADRNKMILGVTCERCHGPAESHVNFHRENPQAKAAFDITHPGDLSRERMNDICAQCHSGESREIQSTYKFRPGDSIHKFKRFPKSTKFSGGVHTANQTPRLLKSKCYTESDTMSCATCHNPHQHERGKLDLFSERCMKCHQSEDCGKFTELGRTIESNCIDCHMPKRNDSNLKIETTSEVISPEIRDHFIRVHDKATAKALKSWGKENQGKENQ